MRRVIAYGLTMAIPVVGFLASFVVGWCAWRIVLAVTGSSDFADCCFALGMVITGAAFTYWVWIPLGPAIKRLSARRDQTADGI